MTKKIIAFAGRQGSGKSYRCQALEKSGYKNMAFADALRRIAFATLGIPYEWGMEHYDELKQTPLYKNLTFRNILENLGTEGIRKYDNDFWIKCLIKDIEKTPEDTNICISDLRFYNEYKGIKEYCDSKGYEFEFIFCDFHSERYESNNPHASARLANFLCEVGYQDGDYIKDEDMTIYINSIEELNS